MPLQHRDVGMLANFLAERLLYGGARGIGDMDDPSSTVAALAGQVVAGVAAGKGYALFDQPVDGGVPTLDDKASGDRVAQAGAGCEGILNM